MVVIVWWTDLQLPMQSVPIATNIASSNAVHGEVYSVQHYVIKVCRLLFFPCSTLVSFNKIDRHDIAEILLALNTVNINL